MQRATRSCHPVFTRCYSARSPPSSSRVTVEMLDASRQSQTAPVYLKYKHLVQGGSDAAPVHRKGHRKGVGIEAISAAQPLPSDFELDVSPRVAASSQEPAFSLPPLYVILSLDRFAIQAIIHRASPPDLMKLPIKALLAAGTLDLGGILLLSRRLGLPPQGRNLISGLTMEHLINAIMSMPAAGRQHAELKWLEATAIRLTYEIAKNTLDGSPATSSRQPAPDRRIIIFRIAAYLGPPQSISILHCLVDLGIVSQDYVNLALARLQSSSDEVDPHRLVRTAVALFAHHLEMRDLAIQVGGPDALVTADSPEMVKAMANLAIHPKTRAEDVRRWMDDASRWNQLSLLADVWNRLRATYEMRDPRIRHRRIRPAFDKGPVDGTAIKLFRHLVEAGDLGAARLLASDVLEGPRELSFGFRARFIALAAKHSFASSARAGFERYFARDKDKAALPLVADGLVVPYMAVRLISLYVALAESDQVPDAYGFAVKVAETCFPKGRVPPTNMHASLAARALFIIAGATQTKPEESETLRMRALDGVRAMMESTPRTIPDTRTVNVLLLELAKHSLSRARTNLSRMRRVDVGPNGVALASVAFEGAGDVLSVPKYGGLRMLTDTGRRGAFNKVLNTKSGKAGLLNKQAAEVVRGMDEPKLRRRMRGRARNKVS
ncbi:hypothetical protein BKA62DRAFT_672237 [Auriculariales sp. MPI-PUGE-AT-0066]|nr:hypothetical protein BKA62DRAFT_672237 [Auriculariales sp. MPI-PUGE-AT-0066]